MVLADSPYNNLCARVQASSAHDVFPMDDNEDAMSFMSSVTAPGAYSHSFVLTLRSSNRTRASLRG